MSDWSGKHLWPPRMKRHAIWSRRGSDVLTKLADWPPPVKQAFVLLLIVLAGSLVGCATTSARPDSEARNPSMPAVSTPQPSKTYSDSVADDFKRWREMLTGTPATPSNSSKAGPSKQPK